MKIIKSLAIVLLFITMAAKANEKEDAVVDTVFVNANGIYLMFPSDIDISSVGNPAEVSCESKDKVLILKAKKIGFNNMPLLVKYGEVYFNAIVVYKENIKEHFTVIKQKEYNDPILDKSKKQFDEENDLKEKNKVRKNIEKVSFLPEELGSIGIYDSKITFMLTNIRHDGKYLYLRFKVVNNSSFDFVLDYLRFKVIEDKKKDNLTTQENNDLQYYLSTETESIESKNHAILIYALPNFATSGKGGINTIIKEKHGSRKLSLLIDSKYILDCKKL